MGRDGVTVSICPQPRQLGPPPAQKDICWEKILRVVFRFFLSIVVKSTQHEITSFYSFLSIQFHRMKYIHIVKHISVFRFGKVLRTPKILCFVGGKVKVLGPHPRSTEGCEEGHSHPL